MNALLPRAFALVLGLGLALPGLAATPPQASSPASPAQAPEQPVALAVKGIPADAPLTVTARRDGLSLRIQVELQPEWHLYGRDVGGGQPVDVTIASGAFAAAGALVTPMDGNGLIRGTADLVLPLRRVTGGVELEATMRFMVCDALHCLPPIELELTAPSGSPAQPLRVLLVAVDESERTQRIASYLRERGIELTATTYAKVTTGECDRHEVVLADSPTFNQHKDALEAARAFPRTASPVVAVGFLGTELLEAHKVAMACGYI